MFDTPDKVCEVFNDFMKNRVSNSKAIDQVEIIIV
jgi:hypothetical protein